LCGLDYFIGHLQHFQVHEIFPLAFVGLSFFTLLWITAFRTPLEKRLRTEMGLLAIATLLVVLPLLTQFVQPIGSGMCAGFAALAVFGILNGFVMANMYEIAGT
jgi:hypothetical protein